jgi:hypothetical protein
MAEPHTSKGIRISHKKRSPSTVVIGTLIDDNSTVCDLLLVDQTKQNTSRRLLARVEAHGKAHLIAAWDSKRGDRPDGTAPTLIRPANRHHRTAWF